MVKTKADLAIRCIHNGRPQKVCLIEDKRVEHESHGSAWEAAVHQLTNYMTTSRAHDLYVTSSLYGIVTIGHYSRFCEMIPYEQTLRDYSTSNGAPLHFKHNELQIDAILCELVAKIRHSNSTQANYSTPTPQANYPAATSQAPPNWEWDAGAQRWKYWNGTGWVWQQ